MNAQAAQKKTLSELDITWRDWLKLVAVTVLVPGLAVFVAADTLRWTMGWVFIGVMILGGLGSRLYILQVNPGLLEERAKFGKGPNVEPYDKVLAPIVGVFGSLVSWIVAGLDHRFGWSPEMAPWLPVVATAILLASYAFGTWAMKENRFFSGTVRIQQERGHRVVDSGPYRIVRHPGYSGALVAYFATAIVLESTWALIPAAITLVALVIRTALEDRTLQRKLPGYAEYTQRTRFRLIPGIW